MYIPTSGETEVMQLAFVLAACLACTALTMLGFTLLAGEIERAFLPDGGSNLVAITPTCTVARTSRIASNLRTTLQNALVLLIANRLWLNSFSALRRLGGHAKRGMQLCATRS
jgi:hypothetical protein